MALKATTAVPKPSLDVRYVPINSVQFWKENPWNHDNAVPRLAELIAIHGQVPSVIAWKKNNVIYKGNHTKKALQYLSANIQKIAKTIGETPESILARVNPDQIKVEFRDFPSEAAANAFGISDNNASQGGEYDDEALRKLLRADEEYYNAKRTGFTEKELKSFRLSTVGSVGKLENIDLQGDTGEMGEFMILTFGNAECLAKFKEAFACGATDRKIDFSTLINAFNQEWADFFKDVDIAPL